MGDGRGRGWAPELRGILSLEVVRRSGKLKRKHDAERAAAGQAPEKRPRLELGTAGQEEEEHPLVTGAEAELAIPDITVATEGGEIIDLPAAAAAAAATGVGAREMSEPSVGGGNGSMLPLAAVRGSSETAAHAGGDLPFVFASEDDGAAIGAAPADERFDETAAPLVHPADSGPISLGTKHAVHLLRERFGPEAADSPSQRSQASVLFQELLPEHQTSKADATKMFFEVLVLATKDAIKVEQDPEVLGAPIRVRGKRGLWGAWAETRAGGEISSQEEEEDGVAGATGDAGTAAPAVAIPAVAAPVALGQVAVGA
jgi:cohesin complex subunit SCC1